MTSRERRVRRDEPAGRFDVVVSGTRALSPEDKLKMRRDLEVVNIALLER